MPCASRHRTYKDSCYIRFITCRTMHMVHTKCSGCHIRRPHIICCDTLEYIYFFVIYTVITFHGNISNYMNYAYATSLSWLYKLLYLLLYFVMTIFIEVYHVTCDNSKLPNFCIVRYLYTSISIHATLIRQWKTTITTPKTLHNMLNSLHIHSISTDLCISYMQNSVIINTCKHCT